MSAPWSRTKARRTALSPDLRWAAEITRRILWDTHPWQRDGVLDPSKRVSLLVGRGGAKTTTKRARALIKLITLRRQKLGYAAGSKEQARFLNWDKLKEACEAYEIRTTVTSTVSKQPDLHLLDSSMIATCNRTGSQYNLRGVEDAKDAEKFRGYPQAEFQVDECGSMPPKLLEYLVDSCVAPRLGEALTIPADWLAFLAGEDDLDLLPEFHEERGGAIVLGSTPPSVLRGMFYEVTRHGSTQHRPYAKRNEFEDWDGWSSHSWTLKDVVDLPDAEQRYPALVANWRTALRNKREKGWADDHPVWMREYLGRWAADNTATVFRYKPHAEDGSVWNEWAPHGDRYLDGLAGLRAALEALPADLGAWHHIVAMDMGTRDPFACNVFSFAPRDPAKRIIHTFAFEKQGMHAKPIAELLIGPNLNPEKPEGLFGIIGWPDGMVIDSDQALIDELANVYGIRCKKAEKKADYKFGAIELVNGDLLEGRIWILKGSPLATQVGELQWKPDEYGNPREDKAQANHSTDCLVYGRREIANLFESGAVEGGGTPVPSGAYQDPLGLDEPEDTGEDWNDSLLAGGDWQEHEI